MAPRPQIQARPTVYCGIQMRSRLEARYAAWLDANHAEWQYEPRCFANARGRYLPDFLVHNVDILGHPRDLYIEVKPFVGTHDEHACLIRDRLSIIWDSEPEAWVAVESAESEKPSVARSGMDHFGGVWLRSPAGLSITPLRPIVRTWVSAPW